jgi:hypothetical protein
MSRYAIALFIAAGVVLSGCGLGMLQTANTTPAGELDFSLAAGYMHNEMIEIRNVGLANIPVNFGVRYGATEHLDVGATLFMGLGIMPDVKYNFLPPESPLAVSLQAGFGAAYDEFADAVTLHLPFRAMISYETAGGAVTPYAGVSFGLYWIFGYGEVDETTPNLAPREGHGDGVLTLSAGLEFFSRSPTRLLLEYTYFKPVLDDPGDRYAFADNHIFQLGMRF